jgi:hypothetical protein
MGHNPLTVEFPSPALRMQAAKRLGALGVLPLRLRYAVQQLHAYIACVFLHRMIFLSKELLSEPNLHGDIPGFRRLELHAAQAAFCVFPPFFYECRIIAFQSVFRDPRDRSDLRDRAANCGKAFYLLFIDLFAWSTCRHKRLT